MAVIAIIGAMPACAPRQTRIAADADCVERPINSAEEAERRATCYLRAVSEMCYVGVGDVYRREVVRSEDAWQIRSIPPAPPCSTWVVVLSAKDGRLIRFETEP